MTETKWPGPASRGVSILGSGDVGGHGLFPTGLEKEADIVTNVSQENWEEFHEAMVRISAAATTRARQLKAIVKLESRVEELEQQIASLNSPPPFVVPVATLAHETLKLRRDIPVLIRPTGEDFIASFVDAHLHATGDTVPEAIDNLKDILVTTFAKLKLLPAKVLGPVPARQLAVLKEFVAGE
jgi:hypothetical protein